MPTHGQKQWTLRGAVLTLFTLTQCASIAVHGQAALSGGPCLIEAHQSWSDVEKWVWNRLCIGEIADLGQRDGRSLDPASAEGWDDRRLLSLRFLESVLLLEPWGSAVPRQGVRINGAFFDAPIDLTGGRIEHQLWLDASRFDGPVTLASIETRSHVSFEGSHIAEVDLRHANVGGQLNMTGAQVSGTLNMDGVTIGGELYMREGAEFADVNLRGANVGDQLDMTGAKVSGTLIMASATIGGDLFMGEGAAFADVLLRGAEIGGQLSMIGAKVSGTLDMGTATIGGDLFMRRGRFGKEINGLFVRIGRSLDFRAAELSGLDLTGAHIEDELGLASPGREPTWQGGARLILRNAAVDTLQDTPDAWPQEIDLDGFVYRTLGGLGGNINVAARGSEWYVSWLARDEPYTPQPYEQLASVLRRMGHGEEANDVLYAGRERARALAIEHDYYWSWTGQTTLKYTIGYGIGSRYFRSLYWVLGLVLMGTLFLRLSGQHRVTAQDGNSPMQIGFFYSLDMLLPVIHLRQRHYDVDLQGIVRYYFYFHQIMGYVLASFLIAGLSGLTK